MRSISIKQLDKKIKEQKELSAKRIKDLEKENRMLIEKILNSDIDTEGWKEWEEMFGDNNGR